MCLQHVGSVKHDRNFKLYISIVNSTAGYKHNKHDYTSFYRGMSLIFVKAAFVQYRHFTAFVMLLAEIEIALLYNIEFIICICSP